MKKGVPGETRTLDPMIKSHLLYQLSYGDVFSACKIIKISWNELLFQKYFFKSSNSQPVNRLNHRIVDLRRQFPSIFVYIATGFCGFQNHSAS